MALCNNVLKRQNRAGQLPASLVQAAIVDDLAATAVAHRMPAYTEYYRTPRSLSWFRPTVASFIRTIEDRFTSFSVG